MQVENNFTFGYMLIYKKNALVSVFNFFFYLLASFIQHLKNIVKTMIAAVIRIGNFQIFIRMDFIQNQLYFFQSFFVRSQPAYIFIIALVHNVDVIKTFEIFRQKNPSSLIC